MCWGISTWTPGGCGANEGPGGGGLVDVMLFLKMKQFFKNFGYFVERNNQFCINQFTKCAELLDWSWLIQCSIFKSSKGATN